MSSIDIITGNRGLKIRGAGNGGADTYIAKWFDQQVTAPEGTPSSLYYDLVQNEFFGYGLAGWKRFLQSNNLQITDIDGNVSVLSKGGALTLGSGWAVNIDALLSLRGMGMQLIGDDKAIYMSNGAYFVTNGGTKFTFNDGVAARLEGLYGNFQFSPQFIKDNYTPSYLFHGMYLNPKIDLPATTEGRTVTGYTYAPDVVNIHAPHYAFWGTHGTIRLDQLKAPAGTTKQLHINDKGEIITI